MEETIEQVATELTEAFKAVEQLNKRIGKLQRELLNSHSLDYCIQCGKKAEGNFYPARVGGGHYGNPYCGYHAPEDPYRYHQ
jgi:hypothetical protein